MIVWAESTAGASVVKTKTQPANQRLSAVGVPFFVALPAFLPGTIGLLRIQAIGMHPAPHLMLAACPTEFHCQGAQRFRVLAFQGGAQLQRRSHRVTQYHTAGIEADDKIGSLLDRRTHALTMSIAAVGHGHIAWSQGEMLERFARVDIADEHLEKLQRHQVHRDMEAMIGACGAWGLNTAGVDHHKAPPLRQGLHGGQRKHAPQHRFDPWTTGTQALRHRLVRHGLIEGCKGACHLAQGFVQATV